MKKSLVYTRTGDSGTTSLVGGQRVLKSDLRLDAYGTIDELNSFIGLLIAEYGIHPESETLFFIQNKLFAVGGYLATDTNFHSISEVTTIHLSDIERIESRIDELDHKLPKLTNFIIPGGSKASAVAHLCRSVTRRGERLIVKMNNEIDVDQNVLKFINRISDYFFVLARTINIEATEKEIFWNKSCK